jgi:amino acid transporter/nucleotide-binding universal stress UspA family protein
MSTTEGPAGPAKGRGLTRAAQVIVVSSVMFSFISYWRTAAVVLCDLASTAYYIGAIVESAIGPAAPWFILGVMVFSYAVRSVYIESCSLFVRGGVYRVVRTALGGFLAKVAVSALMFDYILTGPISAVTAGQYVVGLALDTLAHLGGLEMDPGVAKAWKAGGSVVIAVAITLYFFRQNLLGIHESSDKALKIMVVTTVMAVVLIGWCGVTLAVNGASSAVPIEPDLRPHQDPSTGQEVRPQGFLSGTPLAGRLEGLQGTDWLSLIGLAGIFIAFGHSILAMSGEETLAQVYREVEAPKLKNFKRAAFIVFVYSLFLTAGSSFLAVLLIPAQDRTGQYADNLLGGLAMNVLGPPEARLLLNAFVVVVGFLILAGAVNTAFIGSNGVLNRVAEDGVMPDWFLRPHPRYGTTYRVLYLILILQLFTIIASRGDVILLGEAYAFGVVWSFVFNATAMVVLRFKAPGGREFKVPLNVRVGRFEIPVGLGLIWVVLVISAVMNLLTKETATKWGAGFTLGFLVVFMVTERYHERRRRGARHQHLEQFNRETAEVTPATLGLTRSYRKLVAIRSPQNLFMLEKALNETDPRTTSVIVMTAKVSPQGDSRIGADLDVYDQQLMTAVVDRAERAGKEVRPLIVPTNNPLHAVLKTAQELQVQELVMGASNKYTADEQLEQIAFYWISLHHGQPAPLTVRVISRDRDVYLDLGGGHRIPKISERQARSVAELRAAGVGVGRVLLAHDGTRASTDLFQAVLTLLDPQVSLALVPFPPEGSGPTDGNGTLQQDRERARQLGREVSVLEAKDSSGEEIVRLARVGQYDLIILPVPEEPPPGQKSRLDGRPAYVLDRAHCRVFLAGAPLIPQEVDQ